VSAVVHANPNVVVVLSNGAPVEMPWHNAVPAILEAYLAGQASGSAIADVLTGIVNPSGKLAESFPLQWQDHPAHLSFPGTPHDVEYRESLYVGYRYYDTAAVPVLFPFGHGLSYTTFHYDNLRVPDESLNPDDGVSLAFDVTNTGTRAGAEVVQMYVHDVTSTLFRPVHELKAFRKIHLNPGERTTLMFHLPRRAFACYDDRVGEWLVESGKFEVRVGASSRDIRCRAVVDIASADVVAPLNNPALTPYYDLGMQAFTAAAFHALLGYDPQPSVPQRGFYTINTPIVDMHESFLGRLIHRILKRQLRTMTHADPGGPTELLFAAAAEEIPLRLAMTFSRGVITLDHIEWLLALINGRFGEAMRRFPTLFRRNRGYTPPHHTDHHPTEVDG
ncbi:MAG: Thermostable beta-glucosidase, partial [Chloroflexota bacterium]